MHPNHHEHGMSTLSSASVTGEKSLGSWVCVGRPAKRFAVRRLGLWTITIAAGTLSHSCILNSLSQITLLAMTRNQRLALSLMALLTLIFSVWMYLVAVPLGLGLSDTTLHLLDDFLHSSESTHANADAVGGSHVFDDSLASESGSVLPIDEDQDFGRLLDANALTDNFLSQVYLISLPRRTDRRLGMERVRQVIGFNWTYVDAMAANDPIVNRIIARTTINRAVQLKNLTHEEEFAWPVDWSYGASSDRELKGLGLPVIMPSSSGRRMRDITTDTGYPHIPLTCAVGNRTSGPPYENTLPPYLVLTPPKIACWYSHLHALARIAEGDSSGNEPHKDDDVSLILEDDVDMERDFHQKVDRVRDALPADWEMLFLGARRS